MNAYPVHISQGVQLIDKSAQFIQFFVRGHMVNTEYIEILSELRFLFNDVFTRKIIDIYLSKRISDTSSSRDCLTSSPYNIP